MTRAACLMARASAAQTEGYLRERSLPVAGIERGATGASSDFGHQRGSRPTSSRRPTSQDRSNGLSVRVASMGWRSGRILVQRLKA